MSFVNDGVRETAQCDGCGRLDAGPGAPLVVRPYLVTDPGGAGQVQHHYCPPCASYRGASDAQPLDVPGAAVQPPVVGPNETEAEHLRAMRGDVTETTGRGAPPPADADARRRLEQVGFRSESA